MIAPLYLKNELKLVHPLYFPVYDDRNKIWRIRKWLSINPMNHKLNTWQFNSTNILNVGKEINMKAVESVRRGLWGARFGKRLLQEVDESNARLIEQNEANVDYATRYIAKNIWAKYRHPRVFVHREG